MGFSVSGAAAVIFAAMFLTFGMWFTASANSFERVTEAEQARSDSVVETKNTAIAVTSVEYNTSADQDQLTVAVENTGAAQLTLAGTDLVVDGEYVAGWQDSATVAGSSDTRLWLSGERLTITVSAATEPDRVKVVVANGVSNATSQVTTV